MASSKASRERLSMATPRSCRAVTFCCSSARTALASVRSSAGSPADDAATNAACKLCTERFCTAVAKFCLAAAMCCASANTVMAGTSSSACSLATLAWSIAACKPSSDRCCMASWSCRRASPCCFSFNACKDALISSASCSMDFRLRSTAFISAVAGTFRRSGTAVSSLACSSPHSLCKLPEGTVSVDARDALSTLAEPTTAFSFSSAWLWASASGCGGGRIFGRCAST
mmetsp:Transcript_33690/g.93035  ORF Transcript_33690/g.93035 Transcript_33690/m.93035 type:complete len:229 (-) Transcript_33690:9-695(-)